MSVIGFVRSRISN